MQRCNPESIQEHISVNIEVVVRILTLFVSQAFIRSRKSIFVFCVPEDNLFVSFFF